MHTYLIRLPVLWNWNCRCITFRFNFNHNSRYVFF